jgi:hypothetical protein
MKKHLISSTIPENSNPDLGQAPVTRRKVDISGLIDKCIRPVGTAGIITGTAAVFMGAHTAAAYFVAGGVLCHIAYALGEWWEK